MIETKEVLKPKSMERVEAFAVRLIGHEWPIDCWYSTDSDAKASIPSDRYEIVKVTIEVVKP